MSTCLRHHWLLILLLNFSSYSRCDGIATPHTTPGVTRRNGNAHTYTAWLTFFFFFFFFFLSFPPGKLTMSLYKIPS